MRLFYINSAKDACRQQLLSTDLGASCSLSVGGKDTSEAPGKLLKHKAARWRQAYSWKVYLKEDLLSWAQVFRSLYSAVKTQSGNFAKVAQSAQWEEKRKRERRKKKGVEKEKFIL